MSEAEHNSERDDTYDAANQEGTRLSLWKEAKDLGFGIIGDSENAKAILEFRDKLNPEAPKEKGEGPTINDLIKPCRELIYDERDGKIIFPRYKSLYQPR